ncbi:MAG: hypothetical protein M0Z66_12940 [Thermaerobacter sp.]|nr:hypothetical protein [Thermaerobacter sp.]
MTGYRMASLTAGLMQAETALVTATIRCTVESETVELPKCSDAPAPGGRHDVVRHSHARTCIIQVGATEGRATLRVKDDGQASGQVAPGNGLQGMGERLRLLDGSLHWECICGMTLKASVLTVR